MDYMTSKINLIFKNMKARLIEKVYLVAQTDDGEEYPIFPPLPCHKAYKKDVEGELITIQEQDRYDDGTFARSYTEWTYFKIF